MSPSFGLYSEQLLAQVSLLSQSVKYFLQIISGSRRLTANPGRFRRRPGRWNEGCDLVDPYARRRQGGNDWLGRRAAALQWVEPPAIDKDAQALPARWKITLSPSWVQIANRCTLTTAPPGSPLPYLKSTAGRRSTDNTDR